MHNVKPLLLNYLGKWEGKDNTLIFNNLNGIPGANYIYVKDFTDGQLVLDILNENCILDVVNVACAFFDEKSNTSVITKMYPQQPKEIEEVIFNFYSVDISVTAKNANTEEISNQLFEGYKEQVIQKQLEYQEYKKTQAYKLEMSTALKNKKRSERIQEKIMALDESTEYEFASDEAKNIWDKFESSDSKNLYSKEVLVYARRWAKYMQSIIKQGKPLALIAENSMHDVNIDKLTRYMHGKVLHLLILTWKYGDELKAWNNTPS